MTCPSSDCPQCEWPGWSQRLQKLNVTNDDREKDAGGKNINKDVRQELMKLNQS